MTPTSTSFTYWSGCFLCGMAVLISTIDARTINTPPQKLDEQKQEAVKILTNDDGGSRLKIQNDEIQPTVQKHQAAATIEPENAVGIETKFQKIEPISSKTFSKLGQVQNNQMDDHEPTKIKSGASYTIYLVYGLLVMTIIVKTAPSYYIFFQTKWMSEGRMSLHEMKTMDEEKGGGGGEKIGKKLMIGVMEGGRNEITNVHNQKKEELCRGIALSLAKMAENDTMLIDSMEQDENPLKNNVRST